MYLLLRWVLSAAALLLVPYVVPGIHLGGFAAALIVALALGLVNATIRPILILLTLPITMLTLGLFIFVINALMFLLVATFIKGFEVADFGAAFFGALTYMLANWVISWFLRELRQGERT